MDVSHATYRIHPDDGQCSWRYVFGKSAEQTVDDKRGALFFLRGASI